MYGVVYMRIAAQNEVEVGWYKLNQRIFIAFEGSCSSYGINLRKIVYNPIK